jgi:hypothetical protein
MIDLEALIMTISPAGRVLFATFCALLPVMATGCAHNEPATVAEVTATPAPKLTAVQQKFVNTAKNMPQQQQMEFFKKNPDMLKDPAVMAKLHQEMPAPQARPSGARGHSQMETGRPNFPQKP